MGRLGGARDRGPQPERRGALEKGDPPSQTRFHAHENQDEFYHVIEGRCRLEVEDESVGVGTDEVVTVPRTVPHLLHNPCEEPCRLIAVGSPRGPVSGHMHDADDNLLQERYGDGAGHGDDDQGEHGT